MDDSDVRRPVDRVSCVFKLGGKIAIGKVNAARMSLQINVGTKSPLSVSGQAYR